MRVRPRHVATGALAVVVFALVPMWMSFEHGKHGAGGERLVIDFLAELPLAVTDGGAITGVAKPQKGVAFSVDGQPESLSAEGGFELPAPGFSPGLHVARFRRASSSKTEQGLPLWERTVAVGYLQGPFESPDLWRRCAVRLHLGQVFLDGVVDSEVGRALTAALSARSGVPRVAGSQARFSWAGDGLDGAIRIEFTNGKDLSVSGHARIWVDEEHGLHLERSGTLKLGGSQLDAWRSLGRIANMLIGFKRGGIGGAFLGLATGKYSIEEEVEDAVDERGVRAVERALHLPPSFKMSEDVGFRVRYCHSVEIVPGRRGAIGFDIRMSLAAKTPLPFPGSTTGESAAPEIAEPTPAIVLDLSPALLNGLLEAFWRSGKLTELMNEPRWLDAINKGKHGSDLDVVAKRIDPLLPPSIAVLGGETVARAAETRLVLASNRDSKERDVRLFTDVRLEPSYAAEKHELVLDWKVSDVAATCHDPDPKTGHVLVRPCYAELLQMVKEETLAVPNPGVGQALALPIRHLLFKGNGKARLPFTLAHITPAFVESAGLPWARVTADALPTH